MLCSSTNLILFFMYPTLIGLLFIVKPLICFYLWLFNLIWGCYVPDEKVTYMQLWYSLWPMGNCIASSEFV